MTTPLIVDVDTGVDDALALLFLARSDSARILGVTCVSGNCPVTTVARNTLAVLDVAGCEAPVAVGADRPLIEPARHSEFHGADGLGGIAVQPSSRSPEAMHAVEMMRQIVQQSAEPVTLLALGPLTNVALFVRTYPAVAEQLARIVFMGGAVAGGNATPVAEFNVWHDPEAAEIVFGAPTEVVMYGLDVFNRVDVGRADYLPLPASGDPVGRLAAQLLRHCETTPADEAAAARATIGDAGAACFTVAPHLATVRPHPMTVALAPGVARGQTIVDRRPAWGEGEQHGGSVTPPSAHLVCDVDVPAIADLFITALRQGDLVCP